VVNDILMPIIGAIFGGSSLKDTLNITLSPAVLDEAGEVVKEANVLGIGNLITFIIDFIIVAFICFLIVKAFNKAKDKAEAKKKAEEAAAAAKAAEEEAAKPKAPTTEELLAEIRDLLAKK
jgi:large conductance mechanosensitive channel